MLYIESRHKKLPEFEYITKIIFKDWLSINIQHIKSDSEQIRIYDNDKNEFFLSSKFFQDYDFENYNDSFLSFISKDKYRLPSALQKKIGICEIPAVFTKAQKKHFEDNTNFLDLDIFGVAFFMLSRVEEFCSKKFDTHERFQGKDSIAYKFGFLDKPIVDIYIEILWYFLKINFPKIKRKKNEFKKNISCDCDNPFLYHYELTNILRRSAGDLVHRYSLKLFAKSLIGIFPKYRSYSNDPFKEKIDHIMTLNEQENNIVQFNFIPHMTSKRYDGINYFESDEMSQLINSIFNRGHEIGLHPGYNTFNDKENLIKSVNRFLNKFPDQAANLKSRQHYLRWKVGVTELIYEDANIGYDSSMGYADTGGFRCGTSHQYNIFSLKRRKMLNLVEEPLLLMENTFFSDQYLGIKDNDDIAERMINIKLWAKLFNGSFNMLWHNTSLFSDYKVEIYKHLVK